MSDLDHSIRIAAQAALSKGAEDLLVLDVSELCSFASSLVICHGNSQRQVQTVTEAVRDALRESGVRPHHVEGESRAEWVLLDYVSFVVHVFLHERREFFALERLWGDARRVEVDGLDQQAGGGKQAPGAQA